MSRVGLRRNSFQQLKFMTSPNRYPSEITLSPFGVLLPVGLVTSVMSLR